MRLFASLVALFVAAGPVMAASPYDGVYRGSFTPAGNGNTRCPSGNDFAVRVVDGKFTYTPRGESESAIATVGPDGSFSAQAGQRYLSGKIKGDELSGSTTGGRCNYIWSLKK